MKYNKKISLIIPTLNEEKNLPILLSNIPKYIDEIIIVDGHSNDNTVKIAKNHGCMVYYDDLGKGSALIKGIKKSSGDFIITMDADLSHQPIELDMLIKGLDKGYDICLGSRFLKKGGTDDISYIRKLGNKFFVFLVNTIFGSKYTDLCYGYRSFKKNVFNRLNLKSNGFSIETEICIRAAMSKMKILEVPSFEKRRRYGKGKLKTLSDGLNIVKVILRGAFTKNQKC